MTKRPRSSPGMKDARKLAAQRKAQAEMDRRRDMSGRAWCRLLQTWRMCEKTPCRRARECRGDAHDCFEHHWWQLSEEARIWLREGARARQAGQSVKEAAATANAEVARWREIQARYAKPAEVCEPPMPRIRTL